MKSTDSDIDFVSEIDDIANFKSTIGNKYSDDYSNKNKDKNTKYIVTKRNFNKKEKDALEDVRTNIVDLAISSENNFQLNESYFIDDIKKFLIANNFGIELFNYKFNNENNISLENDDFEFSDTMKNTIVMHMSQTNANNNVCNTLNTTNDFNITFKNINNARYGSEHLKRVIDNFNNNEIAIILDNYLNTLSHEILQEITGLGDIDPLLADDDLEEIMIIGVNKPVFVYHRQNGMMETDLTFRSEDDIVQLIDTIARQINRRIDKQSPILDSRLVDGSRVNATIPPISPNGPTLTIRKFKEDPLTIVDLIRSNTLNSNLAAFLWLCIDGLGVKPSNILIAGGTSSGKTTTLNALSSFISPRERIISIEDTLELQIPKEHVLPMETRPPNIEGKGEIDMDLLVKNSLRQRPDRVIVGEVRGKEAITLFTALNTGHAGFGTLHSNNSRETISRLINPPMNVPKIMISAIDFIIMQKRIYRSDGVSFRRVSEVAEVVGMEEGTVQLNKVFEWNPKNDIIENIGISSNTVQSIAKLKGISINEVEKDLANREFLLEFLVNNNIHSINDFNYYIEYYYNDPENLINELVSSSNFSHSSSPNSNFK